jgi:hypothetical protein
MKMTNDDIEGALKIFKNGLIELGIEDEIGDIRGWIKDHRNDISNYIEKVLDYIEGRIPYLNSLNDPQLMEMIRFTHGRMPDYIHDIALKD